MDALDGGMWQYGDESYPEIGVTFFAGTFVRHPLGGCRGTQAVLQHFKEQGPALQARLNERTAQLAASLNGVFEQWRVPTRIEVFGSFFYFGFSSEERLASLFYFYLRDKGIHVREGFPCFLTTAHSDADSTQSFRLSRKARSRCRRPASSQPSRSLRRPLLAPTDAAKRGGWRGAGGADYRNPSSRFGFPINSASEASCSYNESFSLHLRGELNEIGA